MSNISAKHIDIKFLRNYNVMEEHMIKSLINKRKFFSQISTTEEITQEECLKLIKLELDVMELCDREIHVRASESSNGNQFDAQQTTDVMNLMSNRIDHLYYSMFEKFFIGCELLVEYMEFKRKNVKFITKDNINSITVLLSKKKCDPQLFIAAGIFEYENHDISSARKYFEEGIKIHTDSKILHSEQFWIEVMHLNDVGGGKLNEDIAIRIYRNIIGKFEQDMEFHFILLSRSIEIKSIWRLQYEIIWDFMEIYKQSDIMWSEVAKLCSKGFIFDHNINFFGCSTNFLHIARCCFQTYDKGLRNVLSVIGKRNLMELHNNYIIQVWKNNKSINNMEVNILVKREMKRAFQMGHFELGGLHEPEYYVYWAIISEDYRPDILKLAIDNNRDNIHVWAEILEYHIVHNSGVGTIKMIFDAGNWSLKNKSLLLWGIMDSFLQQYSDITLLGKFYEEGAYNPHREISMVYKVKYLAWCHYMYNDIFYSRYLFSYLMSFEPESKDLYMKMIQCEKQQHQINVNIIKNLYRQTCSKFCQQENDVSLWVECIEFELTYCGCFSAEKIYKAALRNVKPQLKLDLRRAYLSMVETHRIRAVDIQSAIVDLTNDD